MVFSGKERLAGDSFRVVPFFVAKSFVEHWFQETGIGSTFAEMLVRPHPPLLISFKAGLPKLLRTTSA